MVLTTLVLFTNFATLFCSLLLVALVYTNLFLAPLLLLFGDAGASSGGADAASSGDASADSAADSGGVRRRRTVRFAQRLRYFTWTARLRSKTGLAEADGARTSDLAGDGTELHGEATRSADPQQ